MSNRKVTVVVVCEDTQQSAFVRRYLIKRNFNKRRLRVEIHPGGEGSGEQFVRKRLVTEVKQHRQKSSYGNDGILLVAMVDADNYSVEERIEQLSRQLEQHGLDRIWPDEKIAVLVPKRNIETWLEYADDQSVDENTAYPKRLKPGRCQREVDLYVDKICPGGISDDGLSSLKHACTELKRIL